MRLHPDGVVEGTPEECAAFKHIDAALAQRNGTPRPERLAIEAAPTEAEVPFGVEGKTSAEILMSLAKLRKNRGVTAGLAAAVLQIDSRLAYQRLYALHRKGLLAKGDGVFRAVR